ncbi:cholesterol oxidase substrate-binding domain-containing protein [Amycolatopsis sp. NPDC021455]|uniref:cholesterol oxidase substrate-binding domain-containing protein n=1 Tax=Amycolatopsis sp. NPDC021455 TaxID=3154901 RepID=UPI0034061B86
MPSLLSRRAVLSAAAVGVTLGFAQSAPAFAVTPAAATVPAPADFPASIPVYRQAFTNWSGEIVLSPQWTCAPKNSEEVVTLANWAHTNGWRLRARGMGHGWSPLLEPEGADGRILIVDTTQHLTAISIDSGTPASVTAQGGVTMLGLLTAVEQAGYGLTNTPAPGDVTLGGVLAIGGHGTSIPAVGERSQPGHTYGSISNLVVSLTAVAWDTTVNAYVLKTFQRNDPDIGAFLVHLGRAFITEATLRLGTNVRLRCQSSCATPAAALFASPESAGANSFTALLDRSGRVETIWFPFTTAPWLKVWSVAPEKPSSAKEVDTPFNYTFADSVPGPVSRLIKDIVSGFGAATPTFQFLEMAITRAGLFTTDTSDIWGWAKNTQLYVRPTTLRVTANGYAILCARADVQRVVSDFYTYLSTKLTAYRNAGQYPMNGPWEVRCTGLDDAADCGVADAVQPVLSPVRPRPDQPQWDTAVWMDLLTFPDTPESQRFYRETEQWMLSHYTGSYAAVRAEWSKGWAYSGSAAWAEPAVLGSAIPDSLRIGQDDDANWDAALVTLDRYDPGRIFSNTFLDTLMPRPSGADHRVLPPAGQRGPLPLRRHRS